jgi:hypothetical protein
VVARTEDRLPQPMHRTGPHARLKSSAEIDA